MLCINLKKVDRGITTGGNEITLVFEGLFALIAIDSIF